jgi:hypothetical protein
MQDALRKDADASRLIVSAFISTSKGRYRDDIQSNGRMMLYPASGFVMPDVGAPLTHTTSALSIRDLLQ